MKAQLLPMLLMVVALASGARVGEDARPALTGEVNELLGSPTLVGITLPELSV